MDIRRRKGGLGGGLTFLPDVWKVVL